MRCSECGSLDIALDKNNNRYCRECGAVLEELDNIEKGFETKIDKTGTKLDMEK